MKNTAYDRSGKGKLTALVGFFLNILLGAGKLTVGLICGSVSVVSDGANNLSDAGTSGITLGSMVLSSRRADRSHPMGHGRYEYIAGLIMACAIVVVALRLAEDAIMTTINRSAPEFSAVALGVLLASVAVKGFMCAFYFIRNRSLRYDVLTAAALDSLGDCAVTGMVALSFALSPYTSFPLDGAAGIVAAVIVGAGGVKLMLSTINKLLGSGRDPEVEAHLTELIASEPKILGFHDLVVHDYGARKFASVDAEFARDLPFSMVHAAVDGIEREAKRRFDLDLRVHCDPVDTDETSARVKERVMAALSRYGGEASFHELAISQGERRATIHLRLSERLMKEREHVLAEVMEAVDGELAGYSVEAEFDFM